MTKMIAVTTLLAAMAVATGSASAAAPADVLTASNMPDKRATGAMTYVDGKSGAKNTVLSRSRLSARGAANPASAASVSDTSKGFKSVLERNLQVSIYTDSELSQPLGSPVYYTASSGQNGAPPMETETATIQGRNMWTRKSDNAHTASHGGTTAMLECDVNAAQTNTNCTVSAIDTTTGHVKWSNVFDSAIPSDHVSIQVTTDGSHIAIAVTEFVPPLPSHSFHSSLKIYTTHTGVPIAVHNAANLTQARDVAVADSYAAIVSQNSVDVYSLTSKSVEFSQQFDFSSGTMCIAPDGSSFAYGFESMFVYKRVAASGSTSLKYEQSAVIPSPNYSGMPSFAGTCAMSTTDLAVGWYAESFKQNTVTLYDVKASKSKYAYAYPPDTGSIYQNLPVASAFSTDGAHFVVGAWGSSNQTSPTVAAFSTAVTHPIAELTTVGSIFAVDIHRDASDGTVYVSASGKAVPANMMGDGGILRVLEVDHPTTSNNNNDRVRVNTATTRIIPAQ